MTDALRRTDDMGMEDADEALAGSPDLTLQSSQLAEIDRRIGSALHDLTKARQVCRRITGVPG